MAAQAIAPRVLQRARQAATVARSWFWPVQGPYTSAVLVSEPSSGAQSWFPATPQTALAVAAVYRALAVYADLVGTLPVRRYRGQWEILPEPPFVTAPHGAPMGWTDEIGQVIWSLLLRGNAYAIPTAYDWTGYPATWWVANPDLVAVEPAEGGGVQYRVKTDWGTTGGEAVYVNPHPTELLHLRWQTPPGGYLGIGILDAAGGPGGAITASANAERYAADLTANPTPPAVLTHPLRLNAQQAADLQGQWATSVGRSRAVPAVLSGGITYTPLNVTAADVQLMEQRKYNATQVATLFGLPPYLVGGDLGSSLTYATVEGENTRLWTDALQPMAIRLQRALGTWTPAGQRLVLIPDAILRSQTLDRYQAHKIGLEAGFLTVDEVRALENLPPMEVLPQTPEAPTPPPQPALPPGGTP